MHFVFFIVLLGLVFVTCEEGDERKFRESMGEPGQRTAVDYDDPGHRCGDDE